MRAVSMVALCGGGGAGMMSPQHAQGVPSQKEQVSIAEVTFFLHRLVKGS